MIPKKIVIFGSAGTGKSSTGKLLAEKLGYSFNSTGNIMREKAHELDLSIYEFDELCKTHPNYDLELDQKVKYFGKTHECFIFESRLAWYFIPDSYKIYFECDNELITQRISKREDISFEEAKQKTMQRNSSVLKRYSTLYPHISYPPKKEIFDLIIDTTGDTVEESVQKILDIFERKN